MTATADPPARATRPNVRQQGDFAQSQEWGDPYEAAAYEEQIGHEAAAIWADAGDNATMTHALFARLYPLLRRPLHPGHIVATSKGKGKPYDSDGARSVQVLIDRCNIVLGAAWWRDRCEYHADGALAEVTVEVITAGGHVLVSRSSWGGMDRANTKGNLRKASYTNAAKLAFARLGPGHEVYAHAIDYDPDMLPGALEDQNREPVVRAVAPAIQQQAQAAQQETDPGDRIDTILMVDDALKPKRAAAVEGMRRAGAGDAQIARELKTAHDGGEKGIVALIKRVEVALGVDETGGEA